MEICVGIPAYNMKIDARLAAHLVAFAVKCGHAKINTSILPIHAVPVARAREKILRQAMATPARWLWSIDADCYPEQSLDVIKLMRDCTRDGIAHLAVPAKQRNGEWPIWISQSGKSGRDFPKFASTRPIPIHAVGGACFFLDLDAARKSGRGNHPWFYDAFSSDGFTGEDYNFCRVLATGGIEPHVLPIPNLIRHVIEDVL